MNKPQLTDIPEFGKREADKDYLLRPGAYAIICDEQARVAVVRTPGGVFLPGGGQDQGESLEQAVVREVREETGLDVSAGEYVGTADELACVRGKYVRKRCAFFRAEIKTLKPIAPIERDHELMWMAGEEASEGVDPRKSKMGFASRDAARTVNGSKLIRLQVQSGRYVA